MPLLDSRRINTVCLSHQAETMLVFGLFGVLTGHCGCVRVCWPSKCSACFREDPRVCGRGGALMSQGSLERRGSARCALGFEPSLCPAWHGRCFPLPSPLPPHEKRRRQGFLVSQKTPSCHLVAWQEKFESNCFSMRKRKLSPHTSFYLPALPLKLYLRKLL